MIKNEYMKLSRDANASQRRRQAQLDNNGGSSSIHNQNGLNNAADPNGHEVVVSGSPTAEEGGDAKSKKRKGKQPVKDSAGGGAISSSSTNPLPDGEAEARHSVGELPWDVTPAPIGTVGGSFAAADRSADCSSSSFLGERPAVKLEQQYQQHWQ
ncbi:unnamed protein product, partial [Ectocarpus fasciculatus]